VPGETAVDSYRRVADTYGPLGYSLEELRERGEDERAVADAVLAAALGIGGVPSDEPASRTQCLNVDAGQPTAEFPSGAGVLVEAGGAPTEVHLRRFADTTATEIARVGARKRIVVLTPADQLPERWVLSTSAPATLCPLR